MVGDGLKKKGFVDRLKMMAEIVDGEPKDQEKLRVKYQAHFQISASAADARAFKPVAPDELKGGVGSTTPLYTTLQAGQAKQTPKGHSLSDGASGVG
jgi:hypothetical protein